MKILIDKIIIREDLYPRLEIDTKKIQEYSENIEKLPPIELNQDNILIDGMHRMKAHKQAGLDEIEYIVFETKSDNDIIMRAIETNATHGLQLNYKEKKSLAVKLYHDDDTRRRLLKVLSVSPSTFDKWTANKKKELDEERNQKILNLYLRCWTMKQIAETVGMTEDGISKYLKNYRNNKFMETIENFKPNPYNIWSYGKQEPTDTKVFGTLPQDIVEQLLYYYTEPFDVVYDPFGGAGITVDACKKWYRRYYVTDRKPSEIALTKNIKKAEIQEGIPKLPEIPKLVFMDPPYWQQSKGKYSNDPTDLANMSLEDFEKTLTAFFKELKRWLNDGSYIALIIGMTQSNHQVNDHAISLYKILDSIGFSFVQRVNVPYSTQQVNEFDVSSAKKGKYMLKMYRDLLIFKKGE